jgi:formylglycine-generating enzyme required for sulfatase activity
MLALGGLVLRTDYARSEDPKPAQTFANSIGMKFVLIPAGEFQMGSPNDEEGPERPFGIHPELQHKVRITRPFYLGVYHVTQEEYQRMMGANPSRYSAAGEYSSSVQGLETRFPV